jgi:hypothetical protein
MERISSPDTQAWKQTLIAALSSMCQNTPLADALENSHPVGVHLAVFVEPYLTFLLQGKKTIESRFSVNKHAPFEQVQTGDIIILKKSSGPICGICRVASVWYYRLDPDTWPEIERYAKALCMDDSEFWERKKAASFATLMPVEDVCRVEDFPIDKVDPRSWVVVRRAPPKAQGSLL